ncbi:MAG: siroheme synthase CysG [Pseudomonadota bacterium]
MRYFPVFVDLEDIKIIVSGAGEMAVAKLRLLLKTSARITVFGANPASEIATWANEGRITLFRRSVAAGDTTGAVLLYAANNDAAEDARAAAIGRSAGALVNIVDNIDDSAFITPAIIDRDPVVVAIGTEGAAPVLGRRIKADVEQLLPGNIGTLARIGKRFRPTATKIAYGRARRAFWADYYEQVGPAALAEGGEAAVESALEDLLRSHLNEGEASAAKNGKVWIVGAGPGDPELLTLKARRVLHDADVIITDRLVSSDVLELARREATFIEVGKVPGGRSWAQDDINALMIEHALSGAQVVRLKSGDPAIYGRLDEEMDALDAAAIEFEIVPGITSALAAAARSKLSLTRRGRNSEFRFLTGQDIAGFAEHDWRALARSDAVAAIYMGVRAARFLQGRLLMHGADPDTPVSMIENISRSNEKIIATSIGDLEAALLANGINGPAVLLLGISPRREAARTTTAGHEVPGDHETLSTMGA